MPIRFRKTFSLGKGFRLNLGKRGLGLSTKTGPLTTSFGPSGARQTASIPGTGISFTSPLKSTGQSGQADPDDFQAEPEINQVGPPGQTGQPAPKRKIPTILIIAAGGLISLCGIGFIAAVIFGALLPQDPSISATKTMEHALLVAKQTIIPPTPTSQPTPQPSKVSPSLIPSAVVSSPSPISTQTQPAVQPSMTPNLIPTRQASPTIPPSRCPQGCTSQVLSCDIKGNISSEGEKIYHVPGGQAYARTEINPSRGERWFCTEAEARANGWRKSEQ